MQLRASMVGSPGAPKPAYCETITSGNLQLLKEGEVLRTSPSITPKLLHVLCVPQTLKNEAMNFLPCIVAFVGSENRGMSRR